jgi:hypothetical protein
MEPMGDMAVLIEWGRRQKHRWTAAQAAQALGWPQHRATKVALRLQLSGRLGVKMIKSYKVYLR